MRKKLQLRTKYELMQKMSKPWKSISIWWILVGQEYTLITKSMHDWTKKRFLQHLDVPYFWRENQKFITTTYPNLVMALPPIVIFADCTTNRPHTTVGSYFTKSMRYYQGNGFSPILFLSLRFSSLMFRYKYKGLGGDELQSDCVNYFVWNKVYLI